MPARVGSIPLIARGLSGARKPGREVESLHQFEKDTIMGALAYIAIIATFVAAWFTHVFHCLATGEWAFLIAGALVFPIAWIHGIGLWFGWF